MVVTINHSNINFSYIQKVMDKIIFSVTAFGMKHTIELSEDSDIEQMFTAFRAILVGLTYPEVVIDNHIAQLAEEIIPNEV